MTESKSSRRHPNVAHLDEVKTSSFGKGSKFGQTNKGLSRASGGKSVGCSWYEVAPGKSAYPAHYHCALEESIYILEGQGTMRIGNDRVEVRAGDYIAFPIGPDHAHRLFNTGSAPLRYLCMSARSDGPVEVIGYPDSGKMGFSAGEFEKPIVRNLVRNGAVTNDYFEGEEVD
ncbi:MAG TPA: cupin domain-containing protein [Polyangiaceae bacterium]